SWVFGGGGAAGEVSAETPGVGRAYTLEEGLIRGGTLRFIDHGTGQDIALDDVEARLAIPDFSGPFTLSAEALVQGQPVSLAAEAGVCSAFTEGRVVPLALTAGLRRSTSHFDRPRARPALAG